MSPNDHLAPDLTRGPTGAPAARFLLIPIPVSVLDVREHFKHLDPESEVPAEEMEKLTNLALALVPACVKLEWYAKLIAGRPVLN